jgi:uracil-DNA glycosylase
MTPEVRARKLSQLDAPHVRPLIHLIKTWETGDLRFPRVDPDDGGVNAEVLFLQHTPGRRAVGTGFVSRDNPDPTARNAGEALDYAGFQRTDYVRWNVVPYYISTADKDGKATTREVHEAARGATTKHRFITPEPGMSLI